MTGFRAWMGILSAMAMLAVYIAFADAAGVSAWTSIPAGFICGALGAKLWE